MLIFSCMLYNTVIFFMHEKSLWHKIITFFFFFGNLTEPSDYYLS